MKILDFRPMPLVRPPEEPRAPGIHWSDIVKRLEASLPRLKGKRRAWDELTPEEQHTTRVRWELGFIWEELAEQAVLAEFRRRQEVAGRIRQMRLQVERIHGTPDVVLKPDSDPDACVIEETKCSWRSMKRASEADFETEFWGWHVQTKGYAYMVVGKGLPARVRYRVLWVNGEYARDFKADTDDGSGPCAKEYVIEYSARELHENWQMGRAERDRIEAEAA